MNKYFVVCCSAIVCFCSAPYLYADGSSIDKVYDPYVTQLETEVEVRALVQQANEEALDEYQRYKFGLGRAINDDWLAEIYWVGRGTEAKGFQLEAFEGELKWQLTEQGEYDYDWGMIFELERNTRDNTWENAAKLVVLHEWSRWVSTANLGLVYEWGEGIHNEWETRFGGQLKYRYKEVFEPGIEVFLGQNSRGIGPAATGAFRLAPRKKLFWDSGIIFAIDNKTPDISFKVNIEYEF